MKNGNVDVRRCKAGFTLVELMLVAVISSIVASAAGLLLVSANRALMANTRAVEMQRDASLAMSVIENLVKSSLIDSPLSFAEGVLSSPTESIVWNKSKKQLVLQRGNDEMVLIRDEWRIVDFDASRSGNSWQVVLHIQDTENGSEILMPAVFVARNRIPPSD